MNRQKIKVLFLLLLLTGIGMFFRRINKGFQEVSHARPSLSSDGVPSVTDRVRPVYSPSKPSQIAVLARIRDKLNDQKRTGFRIISADLSVNTDLLSELGLSGDFHSKFKSLFENAQLIQRERIRQSHLLGTSNDITHWIIGQNPDDWASWKTGFEKLVIDELGEGGPHVLSAGIGDILSACTGDFGAKDILVSMKALPTAGMTAANVPLYEFEFSCGHAIFGVLNKVPDIFKNEITQLARKHKSGSTVGIYTRTLPVSFADAVDVDER
jgi:hypothetical protein